MIGIIEMKEVSPGGVPAGLLFGMGALRDARGLRAPCGAPWAPGRTEPVGGLLPLLCLPYRCLIINGMNLKHLLNADTLV